jgi:adenosine deaminase
LNTICDIHLHLYGCLSSIDIWKLGKDLWQSRIDRLKWYERIYEKAWNRTPLWREYWTSDKGLSLLEKDYYFISKGSFDKFQACFNLIIALFPIDPLDKKIPQFLLKKINKISSGHTQVRCPLPLSFTESDINIYISNLVQIVEEIAQKNKRKNISLLFSLSRDIKHVQRFYAAIKSWQRQNSSVSHCVVGVDFDGYEEEDSFNGKNELIAQIKSDNKSDPQNKLIVTCHAGESFQTMGVLTSCHKIFLLCNYGVDRLSNTIALGINPQEILSSSLYEKSLQRYKTLLWIKNDLGIKSPYLDSKLKTFDTSRQENKTLVVYDRAELKLIAQVQNRVCRLVKDKNIVIEVCPISNARIGMIKDETQHPLKKFLHEGLKVCIGTDDPGILISDINKELEFCKEKIGLDSIYINTIVENTNAHVIA